MKSIKQAGNKIRAVKRMKSVGDVADKVKWLLNGLEGLCRPEYEEMCDALDWWFEITLKEKVKSDGFRDEMINYGHDDDAMHIDNDPFVKEISLAEYQKQRDLERRLENE